MLKPVSTDMNKLKACMSQASCESLKELIVNNPEAPLLIFVGEEAVEYRYESTAVINVDLEELTLYTGIWMTKKDYEDALRLDMSYDERYDNLSSEEFDVEVAKIIDKTAFIKTITVYID